MKYEIVKKGLTPWDNTERVVKVFGSYSEAALCADMMQESANEATAEYDADPVAYSVREVK